MKRVLVVDDDRLVADTLTLIFEKSGFKAKAAYSADQGLECSREFVPNLLLCDVTMPGRDGLSLVSDVTRELPACQILVLTGFYSNLKTCGSRRVSCRGLWVFLPNRASRRSFCVRLRRCWPLLREVVPHA